ncbi:hypothetical protein CGCTS75_v013933 [Colletotrichum tropicale]|nr:hypothetical protein CGCTS75_v013933 [Colletotrichum tropicale]
MADAHYEQLLRVPGLIFKAAGPVLGTGKISESALRLLHLESGQRRRATSQLAVVKGITYFARKALGISMHYPEIGHQTVDYQKMVTRMVTADHEHATHGLTMRQAVMRIVDKYRIARHNHILHADTVDIPVPVAHESETEPAFIDRQRFDLALREMWGVLDQLQELTTASGRAVLAAKKALALEIKKGTKKEHLTSRSKFMAAEKKATILQSENEELKKENEKLKGYIRLMKKDGMYAMSAIEASEDRGVSEDGLNELEAIPQ